MKQFLAHDSGMGVILAFNIAVSALSDIVAKIEPFLHTVLTAGQIAVALVSVYYIWRKARAVRLPGEKKKPRRHR